MAGCIHVSAHDSILSVPVASHRLFGARIRAPIKSLLVAMSCRYIREGCGTLQGGRDPVSSLVSVDHARCQYGGSAPISDIPCNTCQVSCKKSYALHAHGAQLRVHTCPASSTNSMQMKYTRKPWRPSSDSIYICTVWLLSTEVMLLAIPETCSHPILYGALCIFTPLGNVIRPI